MKIIAIGRNYAEHAKELHNEIPTEPVLFMKPETAVIPKNFPFYIPSFSNEIHYETELVLKICKLGKNISERFASSYFEEITVGLDFTARDIQKKCKDTGLPWEKAKAFDGSAMIGKFINKKSIPDLKNIHFHLNIKGDLKQKGNSADMLLSFEKIISHASTYFTLKQGDMIFTGTPAGVGPVKEGDVLDGFIEEQQLFSLRVL